MEVYKRSGENGMSTRRRRKRSYKFTEKKQSKRGIFALILAIISIVCLCVVVVESSSAGGNGTMYLGSIGVASMLLALVALVFAIKSMFEEESFKLFPYLGLGSSILASAVWVVLYIVGIVIG